MEAGVLGKSSSIKKLQQNNTFSNMVLGAMVASDPAVAQASGWTQTNGNWT